MITLHYSDKRRENYYSVSELKQRGWTTTMINRLMPTHNAERVNPKYRCAAPMKFYSVKRVNRIEQTDEFKQRKQKAKTNCSKRKDVVDNQFQKLMNYASTVEIDLSIDSKILSFEELRNTMLWYKAYELRYYGSSKQYKRLLMFCFIRNMTFAKYENNINNRPGADRARKALYARIDGAIVKQYPKLTQACIEIEKEEHEREMMCEMYL